MNDWLNWLIKIICINPVYEKKKYESQQVFSICTQNTRTSVTLVYPKTWIILFDMYLLSLFFTHFLCVILYILVHMYTCICFILKNDNYLRNGHNN